MEINLHGTSFPGYHIDALSAASFDRNQPMTGLSGFSGFSLIAIGLMLFCVGALLMWAVLTDLRAPKPRRRKTDYRWPDEGAR